MQIYRRLMFILFIPLLSILLFTIIPAQPAAADDGALVKQLLLEGNYCVAHGGVGLLFDGVQTFQLNIEGTPRYAYAYWSGRYEVSQGGDDQILMAFNGSGGLPVSAAAANVAYAGFRRQGVDIFHYTYRSANLVAQLPATATVDVSVSNLLTPEAHGAGLLVISEGPNCAFSRVQVNFGLDGFYWNFPPDAGPDTQVTCTDFPPANVDRALDMQMFVGGVEHVQARADRIWYATGSGTPPTDIVSTNNPANVLAGPVPPAILPPPDYPLTGGNGDWDDYANSITVPAGATYACFQIESIDRINNTVPNGTSGVWIELMTRLLYEPGIELEKQTNGRDAKTANGADVPVIAIGEDVTWTYLLTNTGHITFAESEISLVDNVEGAVDSRIADVNGNNDDLLAPGETWRYQVIGTALDLAMRNDAFIVAGCGNRATGSFTRNTYANSVTAQVGSLVLDDTSHYCNPTVPGLDLLKLTNGNDAKNVNDADVPQIAPGGTVIWSYLVTNTGQVTYDFAEVTLTDSVEGNITTRVDDAVGDNDTQLEPGETWRYQRVGVALTLRERGGSAFVANGCANVTTGNIARNTYANSATVQAGSTRATDTSHYCNPLVPGIAVQKLTNGNAAAGANDPDVPQIAPGATVTWSYLVTNTGDVPFGAGQLNLLDSVEGAVTNRLADVAGNNDAILEPGEVWHFEESGTALTLVTETRSFVIDGCGNERTGGIERNTYINTITAQITGLATPLIATDTSHYCNPLRTATVGNRVWGDINPSGRTPGEVEQGDGIQNDDPREQGIDGIIVELYNSDDTLVATTVTSGGGMYLFTGVEPGDYYLVFVNPLDAGIWTLSNQGNDEARDSDIQAEVPDSRGDAERTPLFTLDPGEVNLDWDAGLIGLSGAGSAAVGNFVWNDQDHDGIQDGGAETGIAGVTVRLFTTDGTLVQTVTTNNLGLYDFSAVNPGTYYIEFDLLDGFQISPLNSGSDDEVDSDFDPVLRRTAIFTVPAFTTDLRWDAGIFRPTNLVDSAEPQQKQLFLPLVLR